MLTMLETFWGIKLLVLSWRLALKLGPNVRWKCPLTANAAQPCGWSRAQGFWMLSNTPSPHRGAGGLKTPCGG